MPRKLPLPPILKMRWQNGKEEGKGRTEKAAASWKSQWCQLQKDGGGKGKVQFPGSSGQKRGRGKGPSSSFHILFFCSSRKLACTAQSADRPTSTPIVSFQIPPPFQSIRKTDATLSFRPFPT